MCERRLLTKCRFEVIRPVEEVLRIGRQDHLSSDACQLNMLAGGGQHTPHTSSCRPRMPAAQPRTSRASSCTRAPHRNARRRLSTGSSARMSGGLGGHRSYGVGGRAGANEERGGRAGTLAGPANIEVSDHGTEEGEGSLTFCDCCAIIRTSGKSYMPSARSNSLFESLRKMMYLTASSARSASLAVRFVR